MILARSPYYIISQPLLSGQTQINIELKIWRGHKINDEPTTNTSSFTIQKPLPNVNVLSKNISPHIRDFFNESVDRFQSGTQIQDSQVWIKSVVNYNDATTSPDVKIDYAVEGYSTYIDGANFSKQGILQNYKSDKAIKKVLDTGITTLALNYNQEITVKTFDDSQTEITSDNFTVSQRSAQQVRYLVLDNDLYGDEIEVQILDSLLNKIESFLYSVVCENKFEPHNIIFKNKYGAFENIYFFKNATESLKVDNEEYQANMINADGSYDATKHQFKYYNTNTKKSLNLTSGFVDEAMNENFKQLMNSTVVFLQTENRLIPLNVKTTSKGFKQEQVDQKISYEFEFEFAFNEINTM